MSDLQLRIGLSHPAKLMNVSVIHLSSLVEAPQMCQGTSISPSFKGNLERANLRANSPVSPSACDDGQSEYFYLYYAWERYFTSYDVTIIH